MHDRVATLRRTPVWLTAMAIGAGGCMGTPSNGGTYSSNDPGQNFDLIGVTNQPSTAATARSVDIQILANPATTVNPPPPSYLHLSAPVSSSPATNFNDDSTHGHLYGWQAAGTLANLLAAIPGAPPASQVWPPGGALSIRVFGDIDNTDVSPPQIQHVQLGVGDDDFNACVSANQNLTWFQIGSICLSRYPDQTVHLLDTSHNPALPVTPPPSASGTPSSPMANSPGFLGIESKRLGTTLPDVLTYYLRGFNSRIRRPRT